ncbi:MAG TPA: hypothetical protein VK846_09790 [Candidatus Limnocylindria bacterium]|nr:hypothetical protein [Candidatus Limnocylindria bacterium]
MKKRIEQKELLEDVLVEDQGYRTATLEHGLAAMRRQRTRRRLASLALSVSAPVLLLAAVVMLQNRRLAPAPLMPQSVVTPSIPKVQIAKTIEGTPIRVLSDEELLDYFKGRPVALLGKPGHQRLILLDEAVQ